MNLNTIKVFLRRHIRSAALSALLVIGFAAVIWANYGLLSDTMYVAQANWNGGNLDKFTGSEQILGKNYPGAFTAIRDKDNYLVSGENFRTEKGASVSCLDYLEYNDPGLRLSIKDEEQNGSVKIELKGYLDQCLRERKDVVYAMPPVNPRLQLDYKNNLTDFTNLRVKSQADCQAYRKNGVNYLNIGLRLENGSPDNYDNEFTAGCEIRNLPKGVYQMQYTYAILRNRTLEIK